MMAIIDEAIVGSSAFDPFKWNRGCEDSVPKKSPDKSGPTLTLFETLH